MEIQLLVHRLITVAMVVLEVLLVEMVFKVLQETALVVLVD
jgi:hypothetical protein